jgi:hypothetical protein
MKKGMLMSKPLSSVVGLALVLFLVNTVYSQDDPTVYVTKTGSKYHTAGCSYLKKSAIPMKLSEASVSYSPCSRCNPPTPNSSRKLSQQSPDNRRSFSRTSEVEPYQPVTRSGGTSVGTTPTGKTIYVGPRGGLYHYSKTGKKVYERKRR